MKVESIRSLLVLAALLATVSTARADALRSKVDLYTQGGPYDLMEWRGNSSPITFAPIEEGILPDLNSTVGQSVSLGTFTIKPAAGDLSQVDIPFRLEYQVPELDKGSYHTGPDGYGRWDSTINVVAFDGRIKGSVVGSEPKLTISIENVLKDSWMGYFPEDRRTFVFPIELDKLRIDPLTIQLGNLTAPQSIPFILNIQPVPEPTTILIFAGAAAAFVLRRRVRKND